MTYAAAISGSQFLIHSTVAEGLNVQVDGQASTPDRQLARQPGSQAARQPGTQARTQPGTQADTHRCSRHVEGATLNPRNNGNNLVLPWHIINVHLKHLEVRDRCAEMRADRRTCSGHKRPSGRVQ